MITEAQTAANRANAAFSTGPNARSEPQGTTYPHSNPVREAATGQAGKARSSKNALTFGLFTMNDFVRDDEAEDYTKICTSLWSELTPEGTLEQNFTAEIVGATWRLRRCRLVEFNFAENAAPDPMIDEKTEKLRNPSTAPVPRPTMSCAARLPNCASCRPSGTSACIWTFRKVSPA